MILKSFLIEKNISLLDTYAISLFYGENIGLKDEIKFEIRNKYKDYEIINLNQDEVIKNKDLLEEQIYNISLFNKNKIIFINEVSDKIRKEIAKIVEDPPENIKIFLFGHNLEKKSGIRSDFEKGKIIATIPCYQDNHRTLTEYLKKNLKGYSGLTQEIINMLIENSNLDRKVLSNEINKIRVLFLDKNIKLEKLENLINNTYNIDFDKLRDSCLEADAKKLNENLGNIILQNEDIFFYLSNLNLRIGRLLQLHENLKSQRNIDLVMDNIRPKIFWKDKPVFLKQLKNWNIEKLEEAKKIIVETEIKMKTKLNNYNILLMKNLLIRLFQIAKSTC